MKGRLVSYVLMSLAAACIVDDVGAREPVAGNDYLEIPNGKPFRGADEKIVIEMLFSYLCPDCSQFQPQFVAWAAQMPPDVEVSYVPLAHGKSPPSDVDRYAKAFLVARQFGLVDETHQAVYDAVHKTKTLPAKGVDEASLAAFYANYGVDAQEFLKLMQGFMGASELNQTLAYMRRSKVHATPSIIVNGRYSIGTYKKSFADMLKIASYLVAKERDRLGLAPAEAPVAVAGVDYTVVPDGKPLKAVDGKITVEEICNYAVPVCYRVQSQFAAWAAELPSGVEVAHISMPVVRGSDPYQRAFLAAQSFDLVGQTHQAVYEAIHKTGTLPAKGQEEERIAAFYAAYGIDAGEFLDKTRSFQVEAGIRRTANHLKRSKVSNAPSIVVNGRYSILPGDRTYADMLKTAGYLIEQERQRQ